MKSTELRAELMKIKRSLDRAEKVFNNLPHGMQEIILERSNPDYSLNHCIRWGTTTINELIEASKTLTKKYNEDYD